ncbi:MAG: sulfatase-like hydrolase/transferase, partial [Armatimonadota bacterium]
YLEAVGYPNMIRAHGVGNNDVHPVPSPLPAEHYVDAWVASRSIHHLQEHTSGPDREKPFVMWASFPKPHSPYDPPEPYHRFYDPREVPRPIGSADMLEDRDWTLRLRPHNFGWDTLSAEAIQVSRAHYYGCVTFQDKQIGRLLDFLEQAGLRENTIVIYTGDHGDMLGDFGVFFKSNFCNGSVRIPMMISAPGQIPEGEERPHLVSLVDLLPTLTAMCDCPLSAAVHGDDLTPILEDGNAAGRELLVSQCRPSPDQAYMVTDGRWKYIYTEAHATEELYDQEEDPQELVNLAGRDDAETEGIKGRMKQAIINFCRETGDEAMLDGEGLARSSPDLEEYRKPRFSGLGDRPF